MVEHRQNKTIHFCAYRLINTRAVEEPSQQRITTIILRYHLGAIVAIFRSRTTYGF